MQVRSQKTGDGGGSPLVARGASGTYRTRRATLAGAPARYAREVRDGPIPGGATSSPDTAGYLQVARGGRAAV